MIVSQQVHESNATGWGDYKMEQLAGLIVLMILLGIMINFASSLFKTGRKIIMVLVYKLEKEYRDIEQSSEDSKQR